MRAVKNRQIGVVCHAAMNRYKAPIIVDMSGRRFLARVAGRDCVRVTPPAFNPQAGGKLDFKLEQFCKGVLTETVTLRAESGKYYLMQA
jgi:hypothetical protein